MKKRRFNTNQISLYLFLFIVELFILSPLIICVVNSFNSSSASIFPPEGFSLRWYQNALYPVDPTSPSPQFKKGLLISLYVALGATLLSLSIGVPAALALVRYRFKGREIIRAFFSSPLIIPRVVFGASLFLLFIRIHVYGSILSLIMSHALLGLPFIIVLLSATLLGVDAATEEAAQDLGANSLKSFLYITLPQMKEGMIIASLFSFITSFDEVDVSVFVTRPGNFTLPIYMMNYSLDYQNPTLAAVSSLLILFSAILAFVAIMFLRVSQYRKFLVRK